jgi:hypothetical protein
LRVFGLELRGGRIGVRVATAFAELGRRRAPQHGVFLRGLASGGRAWLAKIVRIETSARIQVAGL